MLANIRTQADNILKDQIKYQATKGDITKATFKVKSTLHTILSAMVLHVLTVKTFLKISKQKLNRSDVQSHICHIFEKFSFDENAESGGRHNDVFLIVKHNQLITSDLLQFV